MLERVRLGGWGVVSVALFGGAIAGGTAACNATMLNVGDKDYALGGASAEPSASAGSYESPDPPASDAPRAPREPRESDGRTRKGSASPAPEASSSWSSLAPPGSGFHVDFPDKRIDKDEPVDIGGKSARMRAWFGKSAYGSVFTAAYARVSADDAAVHAFVQSIATGCGGQVGQETPLPAGASPGVRVTIQCQKGVLYIGRVVRSRTSLYSIGIMTTYRRISSQAATAEAAKFLDSIGVDAK